MATRSLNKVLLIGNLTRDPELRYTPQGTAVCTFGLATNRQWSNDQGEKKEDVEFHTIVAWNKLAEICGEYLKKGSQTYVEGRLSTREWEDKEGGKRRTTEVIANEVLFLGGAPGGGAPRAEVDDLDVPADFGASEVKPKKADKEAATKEKDTEAEDGDIPF